MIILEKRTQKINVTTYIGASSELTLNEGMDS